MNARKAGLLLLLPGVVCVAGLMAIGHMAQAADVGQIRLGQHLVEKAGVHRGVCAILGCRNDRIALDIVRSSDLLVHVQEPNGRFVKRARRRLDAEGLYGTRIVVEQGRLDRLPYADNLIDVVICHSLSNRTLDQLSLAEILRVLRPGGTAILGRSKAGRALQESVLRQWVRSGGAAEVSVAADASGLWAKIAKPAPDGVDEWTHWQHGPDNNPFSSDTVIRAPYLTQFLAKPYFSTMPSISVIAGDRMFRAAGHMAIHDREEKYLNTLYATNAYNGALLWTRPIPTGFLVHRSLFVATPDILYLIEPKQCLMLEAETGAVRDRIVLPPDVAGEGYWHWIALEDGILYALLGEKDLEAEVIKRHRPTGAWGWNQLSKGYYTQQYPWGYGDRIAALDPKTKNVLWTYKSGTPIDSRALCMGDGRLFLHSEGAYIACLDAKSGAIRWKSTDPQLLAAIAEPFVKGLGFKTTPYALCTDTGLYFGGRGRRNVVGVSAEDGRLLWSLPGAYNATNLLSREGYVYAHVPSCKMLDPLTGEVVENLELSKRSCARLTGCPDALFQRGSIVVGEGTTRYDLARGKAQWIPAFRPPCNDGVIPAGGLLHITQWDCDCNLQLMGAIALAPAGSFELGPEATASTGLEVAVGDVSKVTRFQQSAQDWPTYRADNGRSCATGANVAAAVEQRWQYEPQTPLMPSPATAAGALVFLGGDDCKVRAIDAATGRERWGFHTAGPIRLPPTIWRGRAYVGCADGYIYCLEAATGRLLWRLRAAPVERRIMVFGSLCSTWPVNSGVLVDDGVAYAAAGIINYDGTHVYALDAVTGAIKWQNNTSGWLNEQWRAGVSAQGDLTVLGDKLWLAGGNVASPAAYRLSDGECLNAAPQLGRPPCTRGCHLSAFMGKYVLVGGRRLYSQPDDEISNWSGYDVYSADTVGAGLATRLPGRVAPAFGKGVVALSSKEGPLLCVDAGVVDEWIRKQGKDVKLAARWKADSVRGSVSIAIAGDAIVAAGKAAEGTSPSEGWTVQALDLQDGTRRWTEALPAPPVPNGLCVDRDGQVIVVLEGGKIVCLGHK